MAITVLRLGHRRIRDARISTHCGLVARAFGAEKIIYSGDADKKLVNSVNDIAERWGGPFEAVYEKNWRKVIKNFEGFKIHLSMYSLDYRKQIDVIKSKENILVIVGGEKVPGEVYEMVDLNVAVGNQPHSEIGALAVLLERVNGLKENFKDKKIEVFPEKRGKNIKEYK